MRFLHTCSVAWNTTSESTLALTRSKVSYRASEMSSRKGSTWQLVSRVFLAMVHCRCILGPANAWPQQIAHHGQGTVRQFRSGVKPPELYIQKGCSIGTKLITSTVSARC